MVYKVHDTILDRAVALKILPPELVEDHDRVRRFVQEAKSASALNHPHIVTIYEIGQAIVEASQESASEESSQSSNGNPAAEPRESKLSPREVHYIAMEFINGDTLRAKITRDNADLKRLLEILIQVADGLAKAHAFGIVHRDLKPENIMITEDGYAKVLDFGLAKLIEIEKPVRSDDLLEAETVMMSRTLPGVVMGTVGYMSPEQVQGKAVDQRSDIFSFGCILYEAATGRKPFDGDSLIDSLHKIVYAQAPPIRDINPGIPAELQRIIRKCLSKNPDERYQSIKDITIDLREMLKEYDSLPPVSAIYSQAISLDHTFAAGSQPALPSGASSAVQPARRRWLAPVAVGLCAIAVAIIAFALFKLIAGKSSDATLQLPFQAMNVTRLTSNGKSNNATISPDGKYVVHVFRDAGKESIWVRQVATSSNVEIVPPAEVEYRGTAFSRDGNFVYFTLLDRSRLIGVVYQVPVLGGTPKKIIEDVDSPISFSPDGARFVFMRNMLDPRESRLIIANADGTGERVLATRMPPHFYASPAWSPDGKVIACSAGDGSQMNVVEVRVEDGAEKTITSEKWLAVGKIGWLADGKGLAIVAVDQMSRLRQIWLLSYPRGESRRITNDLNDYTELSLTADSKTLAVVQSDARMSLWVAPRSDSNRARQITSGAGKYNQISWTPDGKIVYGAATGNSGEIWVIDADGSNQKQLTSNAGMNIHPAVSPDGRHIIFSSNREGTSNFFNIWRMNSNGSDPKQLTTGSKEFGCSVTPDGKWIVYSSLEGRSGRQTLWKVPIDGGGPVQLSGKNTALPAVSPDGKQVACIYWEGQLDSPFGIGVIPIEGGPLTKFFKLPEGPVRWTADGNGLTYINNQGGVSNIWMQSLAGGPPKQLTDFKSDMMFISIGRATANNWRSRAASSQAT